MDFNPRIIVDVMYIAQRPVLHAVDSATALQAARFLGSAGMTAANTWDTLRRMWIDMYVGPPDVIVTDAGRNFVAEEFINNTKTMAIKVDEVPVEAHNSIGKVERYHGMIRRAYEVISADLAGVPSTAATSDNILQMAVKAVNDTAGPNGLILTPLVFGTYPRLAKTSPPSLSIAARATAVRKAMTEVRRIHARRQINGTLATRNGPNVTKVLNLPLQSEVKVWRENRGWTGPYILVAWNDDQTAAIVDIDDRQVSFRITSVQPYYRNDSTMTLRETDGNANSDTDQGGDLGEAGDGEFAPGINEPPKRRRGRPKGSKKKPKETPAQGITEAYMAKKEMDDIVLARKFRATGRITTPSKPFEASTRTEIDMLIARGVFRFEIYNPHKHGGIRIFKSRIVNEIKGKTTQPYEKSRLVIQGYADNGKKIVLTQSPTIQRASQRIIIAMTPSLMDKEKMTLWLRDITQAYTQSDDYLQRTIIADLPAQLKDVYPKGTVMIVVKPLYGIAEAGAYWWSTYSKHHTKAFNMETSTFDPCLLITKKDTPGGVGIVGMQTDDTLGLSDREFADKETKELRFTAKDK